MMTIHYVRVRLIIAPCMPYVIEMTVCGNRCITLYIGVD